MIINKEINRINKNITNYITLANYFDIYTNYLNYLNQELLKIAFNMKTNFSFIPSSLKIKSVQRENNIYLIVLNLQVKSKEESKDLYISVFDKTIEYNTSFLKNRSERDLKDYLIDDKSLEKIVTLITNNYNIISLKTKFDLKNDTYILKLTNQDLIFTSLNLKIFYHFQSRKYKVVFLDKTYLDQDALKIVKKIHLDLEKLPLFIKDYQEILLENNLKNEVKIKKIFSLH